MKPTTTNDIYSMAEKCDALTKVNSKKVMYDVEFYGDIYEVEIIDSRSMVHCLIKKNYRLISGGVVSDADGMSLIRVAMENRLWMVPVVNQRGCLSVWDILTGKRAKYRIVS